MQPTHSILFTMALNLSHQFSAHTCMAAATPFTGKLLLLPPYSISKTPPPLHLLSTGFKSESTDILDIRHKFSKFTVPIFVFIFLGGGGFKNTNDLCSALSLNASKHGWPTLYCPRTQCNSHAADRPIAHTPSIHPYNSTTAFVCFHLAFCKLIQVRLCK